MKLTALDIPEEKTALADWLENQLVGTDLGDFIAQRLLGRTVEDTPHLEELLGDCLPKIIASGLHECSEAQLQALLAHPQLLLDLQEQVFVSGGEYWRQVPVSDDSRAMAERVQESVIATIAEPATIASSQTEVGRRMALYAVAASLLIGLGFWALKSPAPAGWGFDRSGLLVQSMPASAYLEKLGDAADEWFNKQPKDALQLEKRLRAFRKGCDTLLAAPHKQLRTEDKDWLLERCSAWRAKIDGHLANLATDQAEFTDVRRAANEMVKNMVKAFHARATLVERTLG